VEPPELTFFVHLTATPAWLALTRAQRREVIAAHVAPVLAKHSDVELRWFDAEAWCAEPSDVLVARTRDILAWTDLFEELRDTPLWSVPYFAVRSVIPAQENGFLDHERRTGR